MDAEYLELLLNQVATRWARPLEDYEREQWIRWLDPKVEEPPNPEFVSEALLLAKHSPAFEHVRPDLAAFRGFYSRVVTAHEPPPASTDPEDIEASPETTYSVLEQCRLALADAAAARRGLDDARSKLLHEMVRADTSQPSML